MKSSQICSVMLFSVRHGDISTIKDLIAKYSFSYREWSGGYDLLVEALKCRRSAVAKMLLSNDAKVNSELCNGSGPTALHLAVENDDMEIIEMLLARGAAVNVKGGRRKCTPLCEAVYLNKIEIVELLLKYKALVDSTDLKERTPLQIAVEKSHVEIVRILLENGASVHSVCEYSNRQGFTPLHIAATRSCVDVIDLLLKSGADVNAKAADSRTPLHVAADYGHRGAVEVLLNAGAVVNAPTEDLYTPLHMSVETMIKECVILLLQRGACVNVATRRSMTPLHIAVRSGNIDIIEMLVNNGADVNAEAQDWGTPLYIAVDIGRKDIVSFLCGRGAEVNTVSQSATALFRAVEKRSIDIAELLLENGADANVHLKDSRPLHTAINQSCPRVCHDELEMGHIGPKGGHQRAQNADTEITSAVMDIGKDLVELLLNNGANVNATITGAITPLHVAIRSKRQDLVRLLLERGADVDAEDSNASTALCLAVSSECPGIFKEVLKYHPDVNNKSNQNALSLAIRKEGDNEAMIKALLEYGFPVKPEDASDRRIVSCVIRNGFVKIAEEIFKRCAGTDLTLEFNLTPLHVASIHMRIEMAEMLLECGADVNAKERAGRTPLYFAAANADFKMFELFVKHNAILKDMCELVHLAVRSGSLAIVKFLLEQGCNVDCRDAKGRTPLHNTNFSLEPLRMTPYFPRYLQSLRLNSTDTENHRQIAEHLLINGANVDARDNNRDTPLLIAAREGLVDIVDVLLKHGANVNSPDRFGDTALHCSIRTSSLNSSQILLRGGADVTANMNGLTPLHVATKVGDAAHVLLLLKYGAILDCVGKDGTALHIATREGDLSMAKLLLEHCADVNARCVEGTAIHIAAANGRTDFVKTLLSYGSDINITNGDNVTALELSRTGSSNSVCTSVDKCYFKGTYGFLLAHLVKMTAAGLYVSERNLQHLRHDSLDQYFGRDSRWTSKLAEYVSKCEEEVAIIKDTKIGCSHVPFVDILTRNTSQITRLLGNENIVNFLDSKEYYVVFPIYASMIRTKYEIGRRRRKLEEGSKIIFFNNYVPSLPVICIDRILSYLTDGDLNILILPPRSNGTFCS